MRWLFARMSMLSSRPGVYTQSPPLGPFFHACPPERLRRPTQGRDRPLPGTGNPAVASCSRHCSDTAPSPPSCARFAPSRVSPNQDFSLLNYPNTIANGAVASSPREPLPHITTGLRSDEEAGKSEKYGYGRGSGRKASEHTAGLCLPCNTRAPHNFLLRFQ
jgi:hypothetical protein